MNMDSALRRSQVILGLVDPAQELDDIHDRATGEVSRSNFTPTSKAVDYEPDNDGDETFPDMDRRKTWEYGIERGNGYHQYSRTPGAYSTSGAIHRQSDLEEEFSVNDHIEIDPAAVDDPNFNHATVVSVKGDSVTVRNEKGTKTYDNSMIRRIHQCPTCVGLSEATQAPISLGAKYALAITRNRAMSESVAMHDRLYRVHSADRTNHSDVMAKDENAATKKSGMIDSMAHEFHQPCEHCGS